jgi:hypothetical protein
LQILSKKYQIVANFIYFDLLQNSWPGKDALEDGADDRTKKFPI